ncbi:MAG: helix-hairpin-helix domain-containing protein [Sphingobacteriales bacterium]|nr:helix-hairpin-helix domain-containing protein [Sphingobacteriales bacterium]
MLEATDYPLFLLYMMSRFLLLIFALCVACTLQAQEDVAPADFIELLAEDLSLGEEGLEYDAILEYLNELQNAPLDLNTATAEELSETRLLNDLQVNSLVQYRQTVGELINQYEMQAVPNWDLPTIRKILPFIKVKGDLDDYQVPLLRQLYQGDDQLILRWSRTLQTQEGYRKTDTLADGTPAAPYLGSPDKIYFRYRHQYANRLSYGITAEKDAGEEFFQGTQSQGFDFYSAHLFVKGNGIMQQLALGDFEARFGQGLVMWSGLAFGKSAESIRISRQGTRLRPYTSVAEYQFLRGAAATFQFKNIECTVLASRKAIDRGSKSDTVRIDDDGIIIDDEFQDGDVLYNIVEDGLHNTLTDIDNKNALQQTDIAAHVRYKGRQFQVGASGLRTSFDENLDLSNGQTYSQYRFKGEALLGGSVDYRWTWRNVHFFGEAAMTDKGGTAFVNGMMASLHPSFDMSLLYRNISKDYFTFYATPFAESVGGMGEQGTYIGFSFTPIRNWRINGYFDMFRNRWLRSDSDAPAYGYDQLVQATYAPNKILEIQVRYKSETKQKNVNSLTQVLEGAQMTYLEEETIDNFRVNVAYKLNKSLTLKSRIAISGYDRASTEKEHGYLLFQDIDWHPFGKRYSIKARYAFFDTPTYNTRIYAYENDVLYSYSVPPYYGRGTRWYAVLRYKVLRNLDIWLRYARTDFDDRTVISSGNNQINGSARDDVRAQIRWKF